MTGQTLRVDPEFKSLIPPLSAEELAGLEASIAAEGCRDALVVWDGILIDGHNRYAICTRLGKPFKVIERNFTDRLAARIWIRTTQISRRNLTDDQRAISAARLAADLSEQAKRERATNAVDARERKAGRKPILDTNAVPKIKPKADRSKKSVPKASRAHKVSERKTRKAMKLIADNPDKAAKVEAGDMTLAEAEKQSRLEEKNQRKGTTPPAAEPAGPLPFRVFVSDVGKIGAQVGDESIDWIITDPPYPRDFLATYRELSALAARVLKPGGSALVMVGQSYLPEVIGALAESLCYHWALAYLTPGGQSTQLWDRKVNTFWKPVLWFVKGKYSGDWIGDVCKSAVNDNDKTHHRWGQSESGMASIIERFTDRGQVIFDPFLGGGTTGIVAVASGRQFIGSDIDEGAVSAARQRLLEASNA